MFWKITCIILALLVVGAGIGAYFYGQQQYNTGKDMGYKDGLSAGRQESKDTIDELTKKLAAAPKSLRNPTYQELMDFLRQDQTDKEIPAKEGNFYKFAFQVKGRAHDAGFPCRLKWVFCVGFYQLINNFETVDKGPVDIEPQNDKPVKLEIGLGYMTQNGWPKGTKDDTILELLTEK